MPELNSRTFKIRLENEYKYTMMLNHEGNTLFTISAAPGEPVPCVREYILTYHGETWVASTGEPVRQRGLAVCISLFRDYPYSVPCAKVIGDKVPYHIHCWEDGHIDSTTAWTLNSHVEDFIRYIIEVLQFKPARIYPNNPSNQNAKNWWLIHQNDLLYFPADNTAWPRNDTIPRIKLI